MIMRPLEDPDHGGQAPFAIAGETHERPGPKHGSGRIRLPGPGRKWLCYLIDLRPPPLGG